MRSDASHCGGPPDERAATAVVDAAIDLHRTLGPGLLESVYESCLEYELLSRGFTVRRQSPMPVAYRGFRLGLLLNFNVSRMTDGIRRVINSGAPASIIPSLAP